MRSILAVFAISALSQAQLVTFTSGSPAKAAEVNGNFTYLQARMDSLAKALASKDSVIRALQKAPSWSDSLAGLKSRIDSVSAVRAQVRLDSLVKALQSKDTAIAALKSAPSWGDSLTKIGKRLDAGIPKGTIAAFLTAPGTDTYLPNSDQSWVVAAGQSAVNGLTIPDLRGQFLRGIDLAATGAKDTAYDPAGKRSAGNQQADAFQGHWHQNFDAAYTTLYRYGAGSAGTGAGFAAGKTDTDVNSFSGVLIKTPVSDMANGTPRIAPETRPKNVAVYWYTKVK
ncbi:MAG: hypothetical protein AAB214_04430 [Fibrobacterota bacterium]